MADIGDNRRAGSNPWCRPGTRRFVCVRLQPSEHLRHPDFVHTRPVSASDHREGLAGRVSGAGMAPSIYGHLLVDRSRAGVSTLRQVARLVLHGHSLIVFPEGTRSVDGRVGRFKVGPFLVAVESGLPVVPVAVIGSRHVMRKGRLMTCPGDVELVVHAPIPNGRARSPRRPESG